MSKGWWHHASEAERLAQIDAAIELGMTARQCAMNCGAALSAVRYLANSCGRFFPNTGTSTPSHRRARSLSADKRAYLRGEPINMWGVE
jgi:hypothetical protein